jgi:hypothetical protein
MFLLFNISMVTTLKACYNLLFNKQRKGNQMTLDEARAEAKQQNDNLKKQAAERLAKNAKYNKANKPSKTKGE